MNEYRCTRRRPYGIGTAGYTNVGERAGYYIVAARGIIALTKMAARFPEDVNVEHANPAFDIQLWKVGGMDGEMVDESSRVPMLFDAIYEPTPQ